MYAKFINFLLIIILRMIFSVKVFILIIQVIKIFLLLCKIYRKIKKKIVSHSFYLI